jgi:hypothetical protein
VTTSVAVFEKVAARELSPEAGAELLMKERDPMPKKPGWMPRWIYVAGVVVAAVLLAPILSNRDRA